MIVVRKVKINRWSQPYVTAEIELSVSSGVYREGGPLPRPESASVLEMNLPPPLKIISLAREQKRLA